MNKKTSLPVLLAFLAPLVLLSPVFLRGKALFWGTPLLQFAPWWSYAWKTIASGHLPLWNPLVGMGAPLLANYQSGLLYPPYWVHFAMWMIGGSRLMAWGMALVAGFHLFLAGLGMVLLTKKLKLGAASQIVSSLAFGLSGYLVARLGFFSINSTTAWLPWVLLPLTPDPDGSFSFDRKRFGNLVFSFSMLLLAGHAQSAWYIILLSYLWITFWFFQSRDRSPEGPGRTPVPLFLSTLGCWSLSILISVGICAVQLLPTAEYLAQSQRAEAVAYDFAMNYSFWPWHLLNFLSPSLFGSPAAGNFWGFGNFWEDAVYIGFLPLLLAFSAILNAVRKRDGPFRDRNLMLFLLAVLTISVLFSLGANTPVFPWLYRHVPTFDMFQAPTRWMLWAIFCLALLAGIGAQGWRRPEGWGLYWLRLGTMGSLAISMTAGYLYYTSESIQTTFIHSAVIIGFLGLGSGLLGLHAPPHETNLGVRTGKANCEIHAARDRGIPVFILKIKPPDSKPLQRPFSQLRWEILLALFLAADLLAAGWGLNPGETLDLYGPSSSTADFRILAKSSRIYFSPADEDYLKYDRFFQFKTFRPGVDWNEVRLAALPNTNLFDGIPVVNNYDPLVPGRTKIWADQLANLDGDDKNKMLQLMDVGAIITPDSDAPHGLSFKRIDGKRLRFVFCSVHAENDREALALLFAPGFEIDRKVVLKAPGPRPGGTCPDDSASDLIPNQVVLQDLSESTNPNRSDFTIDTPRNGWLLISDVWYPGWMAFMDGKPAQLLQADFLFRAIEVPKGRHEIEVTYRPNSFRYGAGISLISLAAFGVLIYKCAGRKKSTG